MKLNKFFMGVLGVFALTACSSEEPVNKGDTPNLGEGETRYMSVTIRNANMGTRAGGDQDKDGNDIYEEGYTEENKVNSLRFYFFKEDGSPAPVKFNGDSYYDCKPEQIIPGDPNEDMPNVESILNAVIVINTNTNEGSRNDIKQMVAIANFDDVESKLVNSTDKPNNLSISDLRGIIYNEGIGVSETKGFLMTSSTFYDASLTATEGNSIAVKIKDTDIKSTEELAKASPVDVYVERVAAKVRVTEKWGDGMTTIKDVKYGDNTYTAIALKDTHGNPIRIGNEDSDPQAYVIFLSWDLWWTADKSYLFKKVGDWDSQLGWIWNNPVFFRSYWAENPAGVTLAKHNHVYPTRKIGKGDSNTYGDYTAYCLENAADPDNSGLKMWYDPALTTSNRTLVYLSALIVTVDEQNNAVPVDLAEWAGYKYTKESVLTAMFEPNVNEFYFLNKEDVANPPVTDDKGNVIESGSTNYIYIPLKVSDLELVSGMKAEQADEISENSPRYLSFVNLIPEEKGLWNKKTTEAGAELEVVKQLYQKVGTTQDGKGIYKPVEVKDVNAQLESVGGTKVWDGGRTYYYQELMHLGKTGVDNSETPKSFRYGVVRNHIYEVVLQSVTGLGTPVLNYKDENGKDVWENITPQKPTPDAYFLGARLNILSWRVVPNDTNLDW